MKRFFRITTAVKTYDLREENKVNPTTARAYASGGNFQAAMQEGKLK